MDVGVVRGTHYDASGEAIFAADDGHDLPIRQMTRHHDEALAARFRGFDILDARKLDPRVGTAPDDLVEMGIFPHHTAEIVPHGDEDRANLRLAFFRKRLAEICDGASRQRRRRDEIAPDPGADGRCAVDGEKAKKPHDQKESRCFQIMPQAPAERDVRRFLQRILGRKGFGHRTRTSRSWTSLSSSAVSAAGSVNTACTGTGTIACLAAGSRRTKSFSVATSSAFALCAAALSTDSSTALNR